VLAAYEVLPSASAESSGRVQRTAILQADGSDHLLLLRLPFLVVRQLDRGRTYSEREYLVNAIEMLKGAALGTMTEESRQRALALLERADQSDPMVPELRRTVAGAVAIPTRPPSAGEQAARRVRGWVEGLVHQPWFTTAVVAFFAVWTAVLLAQVAVLFVFGTADGESTEALRLGRAITNDPLSDGEQTFIKAAQVAASVVGSGFGIIGLRRMAEGRRAAALAMFERVVPTRPFAAGSG
jgi:hypothetical protein